MNQRLMLNKNYEGSYDVLVAGAGLAGLCYAFLLKNKQPHLTFKIFEQQNLFCGDRTWSFHGSDLTNIETWRHFIWASWPHYEVAFNSQRTLTLSYHTICSDDFFKKMKSFLHDHLVMGTPVTELSSNLLTTADGRTYFGKIIIDARSKAPLTHSEMTERGWGYQKFVGLEVKTTVPHGLTRPIIMDASIPQKDGYRFIYTLPLSPGTLLIEDTYYSNTSDLCENESISDLKLYAHRKHWPIAEIIRIEKGVLPIPLDSVDTIIGASNDEPLKVGSGAGFFHPVTGYSFLWSARVAEHLSNIKTADRDLYMKELKKLHKEKEKTDSFYFFLNKLMFLGSDTTNRRNIFTRFYRLPTATISRFYAGKTSFFDRLRLLVGRPPIPIRRALKIIFPFGDEPQKIPLRGDST